MTSPDPRPSYRILPPPEGDVAVPAGGLASFAARSLARTLGQTRLFGRQIDAALGRLRVDPTARSLGFDFAEAHLGRHLQVDIHPARLRRFLPDVVTDGTRAVRLARWFLDACRWDEALLPLGESEVDREVDALFDHDGNLQASAAYGFLVDRIAAGAPAARNGVLMDSLARIDAYFAHYAALRDSIRRHGVASRSAVPRSATRELAVSAIRGRQAEWRERDVGLAIGATGELIRIVGGRHRTAIARRLGLARIPAQIRLVHVDWLQGELDGAGARPGDAQDVLVEAIKRLGDEGQAGN